MFKFYFSSLHCLVFASLIFPFFFLHIERELMEERNVERRPKPRDNFAEDMKKKLSEIDPEVGIVVVSV